MIAWLIIAVTVLAVVHFVYEAILLPSFRQDIRYRLFALRDQLRSLMADERDGLEPEAFRYMQESLNIKLAFLHRVDIRLIYYANRMFEKNDALASRVKKRESEIANYQHEEFQAIRKKALILFGVAFILNSLGFIVMCLPVFFVMFVCRHIGNAIQYFDNGLRRISCTSEAESRYYDNDMLTPA